MKEIKAYIRCDRADGVVHALEQVGVKGMTLIDVMAVGQNIDPRDYKFSIACVERYQKVAKLEVICMDEDADRFVEVIRNAACTHNKGDGIICVTNVERAMKIRTGVEGAEAV
jgi:nitrogen regulatory protein PII